MKNYQQNINKKLWGEDWLLNQSRSNGENLDFLFWREMGA